MTTTIAPVVKSVTVNASAEHAFRVFTAGFDTWWPRSHHIGTSPMRRAVIEGFVGGRCYAEQEDGSDCPWGEVTVWEPPHRFVFAWLITPEWKYQPNRSKASEVEVKFTAIDANKTRVELEHRHFERYGEGGETMRKGVSGEMGWPALMDQFKAAAEEV